MKPGLKRGLLIGGGVLLLTAIVVANVAKGQGGKLGVQVDEATQGDLSSTVRAPAKEIGHEELGTLAVGSVADVAVLRVVTGDFGFIDSGRRRMAGTQKLICELTLKDGRTMYDLNGLMSDDWTKAPVRRQNQK